MSKMKISELSFREREIAQAFSRGSSYREIADELFIAPSTVRTHLRTIYRKMKVSSKLELFQLFVSQIYDEPDEVVSPEDAVDFPERPTLKINPFKDLSSTPDSQYFCEGLAEELISRLALVRDIVVIASLSEFEGKSEIIRVRPGNSAFGAKYVLDGAIRRSSDKVRISASLYEVASGQQIWADQFNRELVDILELQDEIALAILRALQINLTDGALARCTEGSTSNFEAWNSFHKGILAFLKYGKEDILEARKHFEVAMDCDPDYVDARVYHAWTFWQAIRSGFSEEPEGDLQTCRSLVESAIRATNKTGANLLHLHAATFLLEKNYDDAIQTADQAVRSGPCKFFGYTPSSLCYIYSGDVETGLSVLNKTMRLTPFCPSDVIYNLGLANYLVGNHSLAVQFAEYYAKRVPSDLYAYFLQAISCASAGKLEDARKAVNILKSTFPECRLLDLLRHEFFKDSMEVTHIEKLLVEAGVSD